MARIRSSKARAPRVKGQKAEIYKENYYVEEEMLKSRLLMIPEERKMPMNRCRGGKTLSRGDVRLP